MISESSRKIFNTLIFCLMIGVMVNAVAADFDVSVSPNPVIVGERAVFLVEYSGRSRPELDSLPKVDGIDWLGEGGSGSSTTIVNGVVRSVIQKKYIFKVGEAGDCKIPSLSFSVGGKSVRTPPLSFRAIERKMLLSSSGGVKEASLDDLLFAECVVGSDRKEFFVGEEVPLEIRFYFINGMRVTPSWPEVSIENAVFQDYSSINPENPYFSGYRQISRNVDGREYRGFVFDTAFRPIAAGVVEGEVVEPYQISVPNEKRRRRSGGFFDDDFFFDPFGSRDRKISRKISMAFPELKIKPLPPVPDGCENLGLVGGWRVGYELTGTEEARVGETMTLKIIVAGRGAIETLKPPELRVDGFTVYPPEEGEPRRSRNGDSSCEIKYVFIPKRGGEAIIEFKTAVFDCAKGEYREFPFKRSLKISKLENGGSGSLVFNGGGDEPDDYRPRTKSKRGPTGIFRLKRTRSGRVALPLSRGVGLWLIILSLAGPVLLLLVEMALWRRRCLTGDEALLRRRAARSRRSAVVRALAKCSDDELIEVASRELIPYLNDALALPPGTSSAGLGERIKDEKIAAALSELASSGYMPGIGSTPKPELRKTLIAAAKKLGVVVAVIAVSFSAMADEALAPLINIDSDDRALEAYNDGDFSAAADYYRSQINPAAPDAGLLYNLGNCLYQTGDYSKALVCYERAMRLAPGDSDIRENLNCARRKLFLPEIGQISCPTDLVREARDRLRPDWWLLLAAVGWVAGFAAVAVRRWIGRWWLAAVVISSLVIAVSLLAFVSQRHGSYSPSRALVVAEMAPVYSLPSIKNGREVFRFKDGEELTIEETRGDWACVRSGEAEGWVKKDAIARLWPNGDDG